MRFKSFREFISAHEGLWLSDDKAIEGWSKLPQPKPKVKSVAEPTAQAPPLFKSTTPPKLPTPQFSIARSLNAGSNPARPPIPFALRRSK